MEKLLDVFDRQLGDEAFAEAGNEMAFDDPAVIVFSTACEPRPSVVDPASRVLGDRWNLSSWRG